MLVVHRFDEEPVASPIAYLERWSLHNQLFGDDVRFLGALQAENGLRLLISQPAIAGEPASAAQIQQFFAVSDTHRANLILMADGQLAPIALRVQHLTSVLCDTVMRLCTK